MMVDRNCLDSSENTPLHLASEQGHANCIAYLIQEAKCDYTKKNKFGYLPGDIAYNTDVRHLVEALISQMGHDSKQILEENKS